MVGEKERENEYNELVPKCLLLLGYTLLRGHLLTQKKYNRLGIKFIQKKAVFGCLISRQVSSVTSTDVRFHVITGIWRRIFGPRRDEVTGEWRRLNSEELNDLYSSPNIVLVIKSRRMR